MDTVEREMTAPDFVSYTKAQLALAKLEPSAQGEDRVATLRKSIVVASKSFQSAESAAIPVVPAVAPASVEVPPQAALGRTDVAVVTNPEDQVDVTKNAGSDKPEGDAQPDGDFAFPEDLNSNNGASEDWGADPTEG